MEMKYGVDGFFLDTVETCVTYPESRQGMVDLILALRKEHPNAAIVLNRGFAVIGDTADAVDGLMYESFTLSYDQTTRSYVLMRPSALDFTRHEMEKTLNPVQKSHGLVVLALDYAASPDDPNIHAAYDRAVTLGAIPCVTDIYLDTVFNIDYKGQVDPKWEATFESPASRTYKITTAVNGFPAGTTVTPSSNFPDYNVSAVVDGVQDKSKVGWRDRAWASMEQPDTHYVEFHFPSPINPHKLIVDWNTENGVSFISHKVRVQTQAPADASPSSIPWQPLWSTDNNTAVRTVVDLGSAPITALRIEQPPDSGSTQRPDIMWIQEISVE